MKIEFSQLQKQVELMQAAPLGRNPAVNASFNRLVAESSLDTEHETDIMSNVYDQALTFVYYNHIIIIYITYMFFCDSPVMDEVWSDYFMYKVQS